MLKKVIGWVVVVLALLGVGFGIYRWRAARAAPEVEYKTVSVEKRRIVARVTASGTLQATVTVQVGAQVSGRISKLLADFNSNVKKGELIAKIDPSLFVAAVESAKANHAAAKAGVARAEAQQRDADLVLKRTRSLQEQGLASLSELQTAETNVSVTASATEVARATLQQTQAALNQAQVNLGYTDIPSPIDGVVISRNVDVGQTVASSLQAPVLFTIAEDLRKMQVHTSVAEGDVGRLEVGMAATFTVDAFPGQKFRGKVGQIRNAAQTVQNVVTYDAVIDVDNSDLRLRPGMTATVTIVYAERNDVLAVPNAALRFKPPSEVGITQTPAAGGPAGGAPPGAVSVTSAGSPSPSAAGGGSAGGGPAGEAGGGRRRRSGASESEGRTVWILDAGKPKPVTIKTGVTDGTMSEVTSADLKDGEQVIVDATTKGGPSAAVPSGPPPRMGRMF